MIFFKKSQPCVQVTRVLLARKPETGMLGKLKKPRVDRGFLYPTFRKDYHFLSRTSLVSPLTVMVATGSQVPSP